MENLMVEKMGPQLADMKAGSSVKMKAEKRVAKMENSSAD